MRASPALALVLLLLWALAGPPGNAQVRPIYDRGAAGLLQALQRLQTTGSALHTGAHPDDEDSAFIARVARGDHARVAYLSLNRGEGGQNIIGPELFEALGIIRTEELLQARRLDGGGQFFTRTFDFGFSKTFAETATRWDEDVALADMVRVIRAFRPLVIYSRFAGTDADGHGHHQFAGLLTPQAFAAAADPDAFPEQLREGLRPWQALKLYQGSGFRPDPARPATLQLATGVFDPALGRSYAEIAAEGRSLHRSQQMGTLELLGPLTTGLRLVRTFAPAPPTGEVSIFDGIDTSISGLAALADLPDGVLRGELAAIESAAREALATYRPLEPLRLVPTLAAGLRATRAARTTLATADAPSGAKAEADFLLAVEEVEFAEALARAAGIVVDPLATSDTVVPGGTLDITIRTFMADGAPVRVSVAELDAPVGWTVTAASGAGNGGVGRREAPGHAAQYLAHVPADAALTQPYFLERPREGDVYDIPAGADPTRPFTPPLLTARVVLEAAGVTFTVTAPVQYRYADGILGEQRRDVHVVPALAVGLDTPLLIVRTGQTAFEQRVVGRVRSFAPEAVTGTLRLRAPAGWAVSPPAAAFTTAGAGNEATLPFVVTAPPGRSAGRGELAVEAVAGGRTFMQDMQAITYPHIQTHRRYLPARAAVQVIDVRVAPVRVGYIMGSGDQVPDALRRMGVNVTLLDADDVAAGDLSRFDTIVAGIRASETRPDFVASHGRLMRWVEEGGTLVVQYQQTDYPARSLPPYPVQATGNSRVTDERAPVRILVPDHPVFTFPNRITEADFEDWVQERNLYAFGTFDERYLPLLQTADPGEMAQRGGQVYAAVGRGHYVYTAFSWFRQLPAGVPGAYRQFANLVSLPHAPR